MLLVFFSYHSSVVHVHSECFCIRVRRVFVFVGRKKDNIIALRSCQVLYHDFIKIHEKFIKTGHQANHLSIDSLSSVTKDRVVHLLMAARYSPGGQNLGDAYLSISRFQGSHVGSRNLDQDSN